MCVLQLPLPVVGLLPQLVPLVDQVVHLLTELGGLRSLLCGPDAGSLILEGVQGLLVGRHVIHGDLRGGVEGQVCFKSQLFVLIF